MKPAMQKTLESMNESLNEIQEWVARLIDADDDPYRELMEAQKRGETIQMCDDAKIWRSFISGHPDWSLPPVRYRIKPKTVKKYLWAYKTDGSDWNITDAFYEGAEAIGARFAVDVKVIRIDSIMIDVEA